MTSTASTTSGGTPRAKSARRRQPTANHLTDRSSATIQLLSGESRLATVKPVDHQYRRWIRPRPRSAERAEGQEPKRGVGPARAWPVPGVAEGRSGGGGRSGEDRS